MFDFKDMTVIITGSGAGMGREAAKLFARCGANVVVNSLSASAQAACDEILAAGGKAIFVQADVGTEEGCRRIVDAAVSGFGRIDVLVNAAGIVVDGSVETALMEDWDRSMNTNVKSVFMMCRLCMPYLRQTKGSIVNVASVVALKGVKNRAIYSATKGAMIALSQSMAAEYIGEGIRINCVSPGTVLSASLQGRIDRTDDPQKALEGFVSRQPMGRLGTSEELARAIVFAAGQGIGFMSGANIVVDGGMTI
ncbi:MAG: SDR family oxidoreductase [Clostridia bacterium]|nr:SDR family oxidoreductase [Clostridia bacterium]